ncbi:uncharacterized protein [Diadema setosum]|uniref:uncharacterized protein n=1 Tax=Diadema setosum TaxID=31175 RepID=UPI003B3AC1D0
MFISKQGEPAMKLIGEQSPLEGFVVLRSATDNFVCRDGFTDRTAHSICGELGFPAFHTFSASVVPSHLNATNWIKVEDCPPYSRSMMSCSWANAECISGKAVKLKCREPGFLGCYLKSSVLQNYSPLDRDLPHRTVKTEILEMECVSTCRQLGQVADVIAVTHQSACSCVPSETFAGISTSNISSHEWLCSRTPEPKNSHDLDSAFNVSYGFCNKLATVPNGKWDSNITWFGSMVTLICEEGYVINGNATLQCVALPGQSTYFPVWNSSIPSCSSSMFCDQPGNVSNGKWNSIETSLGSSVTLTCDDSYVINGSATLRCVRSPDASLPAWNAPIPTCGTGPAKSQGNEPKCNHPGNVTHGVWNSSTMRLGSTVTLSCDKGYVPNGRATLLCVSSSDTTQSPVWNASAPSCLLGKRNKLKCGHPGNVSHGKWNSNTTRLGSIVTLNCDAGYTINGSATLFCVTPSNERQMQLSPVWNASIPSCQAVKGKSPLLILLTSSYVTVITLLVIISRAWCLYQRKRYKPSPTPTQNDGDISGLQPSVQQTVPDNHAADVAFPLCTLRPSVDHATFPGGHPAPTRIEDSAYDQDNIYQNAEYVHRNLDNMQKISEGVVSEEDHGKQPVGVKCFGKKSHQRPARNVKGYGCDKFVSTGICSVTTGGETTMPQARLFDETEYNSLEFARGPAIGRIGKHAEAGSCIWQAYAADEERAKNFPSAGRSVETIDWDDSNSNNEYDNIDATVGLPMGPVFIDGHQGTTNDKDNAEVALCELYAKVDKRRGSSSRENSSVSVQKFEELYATVDKHKDGPSKVHDSIGRLKEITQDENGVETTSVELYVNMADRRGRNFPEQDSFVSVCSGEELYANVNKQADGCSQGISYNNGHQDITQIKNGNETASLELYAQVDKGMISRKEVGDRAAFTHDELYAKVNKHF